MSEALTLVLRQLPAPVRPALTALFDLDCRLEELARRTRDPLVAQMRLTWWADALSALDTAPAPAEPLLQRLAETVVAVGIAGGTLATIAHGWDMLLEPRPLEDEGLTAFAADRGGTLFTVAARLIGEEAPGVAAAGAAWALADLAATVEPIERARALALANARWGDAVMSSWPRRLRPLGGLALMTLLPLASGSADRGGAAAAWRLMRFRLLGR